MKTPNHSVSANQVIRIGQIHLDRIAPVEQLAPQVERFRPAQAQFVAAAEGWSSALSAARSAQTHRDEMCTALANEVRLVFTSVHNLTRHRRKPGRQSPFFPEGLSPFLRTNALLIKRAEVLRAMLAEEADPALRACVDGLTAALNAAGEAVANLAGARAAARTARGLLVVERGPWETEYKRNYFDLSLIYARVPGHAESFFWRPAPGTSEEPTPVPVAPEVPVALVSDGGGEPDVSPLVPAKAA